MATISSATGVLSNILEQSLLLQSYLQGTPIHPDLNTLQLGLPEITQNSNDLASGDAYDRNRAAYLLAKSTTNPEYTALALNQIKIKDIASSTESSEGDVESFVRQAKEKNIMSIITSRRQDAEADFRAFVEENLNVSWSNRKVVLLDRFKLRQRTPETNKFGHNSMSGTKSLLDRSMADRILHKGSDNDSGFEDLTIPKDGAEVWTTREQTFSQAMSSLNEHRKMKQPVAISSLMSQLTKSLGSDLQTHQLADSWQMLSFIADEKHVEHGKVPVGKLLQPRHYASDYIEAGNTVQIKRMIIDGSRRFLEDQFFSLMEREIARNPHQARLGGLPSTESKVKAFVNLRLLKNGNWSMPNLELVNNTPVWAVLFFLIRAGCLDEAVQYSVKNETSLSRVEKNWCTYIRAYAADPLRNLPRQLADRLHAEYNQRIKYVGARTDPYKHALYKIIGRCDLAHKTLPEVLPVTEDWMWLQLTLARENSPSDARHETYNLAKLQANLLHYGERHFNTRGTNAILYFQILLLSGQFERGVQYLASHHWTDAVHFGVVLSYYGLLRISGPPEAKSTPRLLYEDSEDPTLNYSGLLNRYVSQIRSFSSPSAVEYICLICLGSNDSRHGKEEVEFCHAVLRSLILDTREFAFLLGDVRGDGTREPGFVESRLTLLELHDERQYLRTITEQAASMSEREGRIADAILLYHLSEEYDVVVSLINNSLGSALLDSSRSLVETQQNQNGISLANADNPATLARNMISLYKGSASILGHISQTNLDNCRTLLAIVDGQLQFQSGKYDACLTTMDQLGILPLSDNLSVGMIKDMSQRFSLLEECVARNVPSLLILVANCLKFKVTALGRGDFNEQARQGQTQELKRKARNLTTFAGLIKYEMSEEIRIKFESIVASIR